MAVVPIEIILLLLAYIIMGLGIGVPSLRIFKYLGAIFLMVMGVMFLFPGVAGIDRDSLIALAVGTISIALGFYYLIEDSFSHFAQAEHPTQDDGRFHNND